MLRGFSVGNIFYRDPTVLPLKRAAIELPLLLHTDANDAGVMLL